jgi:hypothetical protein
MGAMKARIYPLRSRGRHTPWTEHADGIDGELRLESILRGTELHMVARLCAIVANGAELLPALHSPELVALGNGALLLRGFQSHGGASYVQEWRCVVG